MSGSLFPPDRRKHAEPIDSNRKPFENVLDLFIVVRLVESEYD